MACPIGRFPASKPSVIADKEGRNRQRCRSTTQLDFYMIMGRVNMKDVAYAREKSRLRFDAIV